MSKEVDQPSSGSRATVQEQNFELKRNYLLIAIIPSGWFALFNSLSQLMNISNGYGFKPESVAGLNLEAWYQFMAGTLLLITSSIIVFSIFIYDSLKIFSSRSRYILILSAIALAIAQFSYLSIGIMTGFLSRSYIFMGAELFHHVLQGWSYKAFIYSTGFANFLNAFAVGALIAGAVSCLGELPTASALESELGLPYQVNRLRRYLVLASVHFAIGIFLISSWHKFPINVLPADKRELYNALSNGHVQMNGAIYSTMILSYYVPVSLLLSSKIKTHEIKFIENEDASKRPKNWSELENWRKESGLVVHNFELYKTILLALTPFVAASLGSIADIIAGK